ncbi:putative 2OG-Fe(II) oxygenase [Shewanella bicestrii]|nr:putative 2OG-Fe(II) oxygenase [Shewanella bicestrii]
MMLVPIFDNAICVYDFEQYDSFEGKDDTYQTIDALFALPEVLNEANVPDANGGRALSTVHLHQTHPIPQLLNFKSNPLGRWILMCIFDAAVQLGFDKTRNIRKLKYHRTWANRMEYGCDAVAHRHANDDWSIPHLVAIYYTDVPENSADLVFIQDDNRQLMRGKSCSEYPLAQQYRVSSLAGRLICHDARFLHGTTVHKNTLPRTCLVIEVGFPPLD